METRLRQALARAEEVAQALADPDVARDTAKLKSLGREHTRLAPVVKAAERLRRLEDELAQARELADEADPELAALVKDDLTRLPAQIEAAEAELRELLTPRDPLDDRDAVVEVRAGTGGDEAALFAADLFRMYTRYLERRGWKIEVLSMSEGTLGGLKEVIFKVP
ncbi:MAG: PCRF domain-containing protein, partial [Gemmatimonadota bacterium]|nr:PCRF domain-containing protein [Gemmatimonadota bacterium]